MRHSSLCAPFPMESGRCLRQRLQFHRHATVQSLERDERLAEYADDLVGFIAFVVGAVFLETFLMIWRCKTVIDRRGECDNISRRLDEVALINARFRRAWLRGQPTVQPHR